MAVQFGFHASSGGNLEKIPLEVKKRGGECFQFFSRSPYGGKVNPLDSQEVTAFKDKCQQLGLSNYYIHSPYFINLASQNNRIFYGSIKALQVDIERAETLGARFVVTHIGSAKDYAKDATLFEENNQMGKAIPDKFQKELLLMSQDKKFSLGAFIRVVEALKKIAGERKKVPLIIEIAAGAGAILGVKFEEIAFYLESVPALSGFCFDTAHAFASGYDIRSGSNIKKTFSAVDEIIGRNMLKMIHLNDSIGSLGSRIDRHAHIGKGELGVNPFRELVDYFSKKNYNIDMILETPTSGGLLKDLALLKDFRENNKTSKKGK